MNERVGRSECGYEEGGGGVELERKKERESKKVREKGKRDGERERGEREGER